MMGYGFAEFGLILMILFWTVIIGAAVWLISRLFPSTPSHTSPQEPHHSEQATSPEEIVRRRYAGGEITMAEYEEIRANLRQ